MLSNAYFLAKFRFDTAENEPAKNLQKFANFASATQLGRRRIVRGRGPDCNARHGAQPGHAGREPGPPAESRKAHRAAFRPAGSLDSQRAASLAAALLCFF